MTEHVVDLLEAVDADDQQRYLAAVSPGSGNFRFEFGVKGIAVDEAGQRVMFREISNSLGFALAHRNVAKDRAELKSVGTLPAGETGFDRKHLAIAAACVELDHRAGGEVCGIPDGKSWRIGIAGANPVKRPADHLLGLVAEDRRRAGIPDSDQVIRIGAE